MTPALLALLGWCRQHLANNPSVRANIEASECQCGVHRAYKHILEIEDIEEGDEIQVVALMLDLLAAQGPDLIQKAFQRLLVAEYLAGDLARELDEVRLLPKGSEGADLRTIAQTVTKILSGEAPGESDSTMASQSDTKRLAAVVASGAAPTAEHKNPLVVYEGTRILVPANMTTGQAIEALFRQAEEDERKVSISIEINAFPLEGALAFQKAMSEKYGWVDHVPTPGFWGDSPPTTIEIPTGLNTFAQVIWGRVQIPMIAGYLETGFTIKEGRFIFQLTGEVKQKHKKDITELGELTKKIVSEQSIYKGHALEIDLAKPDPRNPDFNPTQGPKFIDVSRVKSEELIFSDEVGARVQATIFNPVEKTAVLRQLGLRLQRGNLLAGVYGVGKSLTASVLARKCMENGWTYFYVKDAKKIPQSLRLARQYSPAVVFVEDIDTVLSGERDDAMNEILNAMDGVDTKNTDVMVVSTTNHLDIINKAALRSGRLGEVIWVELPDAKAAMRLIRLYTNGHLDPKADLTEVGERLAGQKAADIQGVCERAQLSAVGHMEVGDKLIITAADLMVATATTLKQNEMVNKPAPKEYHNDVERAAETIGTAFEQVAGQFLSRLALPEHANGSNGNGKKPTKPALPASTQG